MFSSNTSAANGAANYIEDVFSTYVWPTTTAPNTVVNGIDLATKGGMVWTKLRNSADNNRIWDSARGPTKRLITDATAAQVDEGIYGQVFNTNGFTDRWFGSGYNAVSWTFRKQPKFFDVVTYTGNITARTIAHNLGSVPGMIIVKQTSGAGGTWWVYHRSLGETQYLSLNETTAAGSAGNLWNSSAPTSTVFSIGANGNVNANGATYVAYLFAHDAGGFGLTGTDNVISCGSYSGTGAAGNAITLGYEPQWVMVKRSNNTGDWMMFDNMRGMANDGLAGAGARLQANLADAEVSPRDCPIPTATGFVLNSTSTALNGSGSTYIYIAIRRGPMKVPTSGTSVFEPVTSTSANFIKGTLEASDMGWFKDRATVANWFVGDRLRGIMSYYNPTLYTNLTNAEATPTTGDTVTSTSSEGTGNGKIYFGGAGATTDQPLGYSFKRAPSFFDEVCYTGTGVARTISHNLQAVPELIICKYRSSSDSWYVYNASIGNTKFLSLDLTIAATTFNLWNNTTPTSTVFSVSNDLAVNASGGTFVAYLFATCAGVSKVGSYTGTGTTLQVNCGFTGGARFVLIKRTDSTGAWYVWDTARGIVAGNDPYLLLNSTAAEVTSTDYIDTYSAGFEISSTAPAAINASGGTFIFLAIA